MDKVDKAWIKLPFLLKLIIFGGGFWLFSTAVKFVLDIFP